MSAPETRVMRGHCQHLGEIVVVNVGDMFEITLPQRIAYQVGKALMDKASAEPKPAKKRRPR